MSREMAEEIAKNEAKKEQCNYLIIKLNCGQNYDLVKETKENRKTYTIVETVRFDK